MLLVHYLFRAPDPDIHTIGNINFVIVSYNISWSITEIFWESETSMLFYTSVDFLFIIHYVYPVFYFTVFLHIRPIFFRNIKNIFSRFKKIEYSICSFHWQVNYTTQKKTIFNINVTYVARSKMELLPLKLGVCILSCRLCEKICKSLCFGFNVF